MRGHRIAGLAAATVLLVGAPAQAQDTNVHQALVQAVTNWFNEKGAEWAGRDWKDVSVQTQPGPFKWSTSEVVYGKPTGLTPAKPEGMETLLAYNCNAPHQGPNKTELTFKASTTKTATTTVTHGVTASEALTFSASVPDWGIGSSSTTTVTYSTSTSSTRSVAVTYSYEAETTVVLGPGLKQEATMLVTFQDIVVPWSGNVGYVGNDTIYEASYWFDWSHEPNPEEYAHHFQGVLKGSLASVLPESAKTYEAQGKFEGVYSSNIVAVDGPAVPMTPKDIKEYCGSVPPEGKAGFIPVPTRRGDELRHGEARRLDLVR